jgi:hypothetical protein
VLLLTPVLPVASVAMLIAAGCVFFWPPLVLRLMPEVFATTVGRAPGPRRHNRLVGSRRGTRSVSSLPKANADVYVVRVHSAQTDWSRSRSRGAHNGDDSVVCNPATGCDKGWAR